jgi:hypothetical protein
MKLLVVNHAGVPAEVLARAQGEASQIYLQAGVRLEWPERGTPGFSFSDCRLIVTIVPQAQNRRDRMRNVLGLALLTPSGPGKHVYAFYDAIQHQAGATQTDLGVVLGRVIAHETGHLLLGHRAHALAGIMHSNWDVIVADRSRQELPAFNADEVAVIRRTLQFDPSPTRNVR